MDVEHRCLDRQSGQLHLIASGPGPIAIANIGGGAAHIEAHDAAKTSHCSRAHGPHQAARWPREDGVFGVKSSWLRQHTAGAHHLQRHSGAEGLLHPLQIALQHRPHVGLQHTCVRPRHQPRQRAHLMGERNLLKAEALQPTAQRQLMGRVGHAVQQRHSHAAHPR